MALNPSQSPTANPGPPANLEGAMVPYAGYPPPAVAPIRPGASPVGRYLRFLARKWWVVVLSVLFFGGLAGAYVRWWPESYAAVGHLWAAPRMGLRFEQGVAGADNDPTFVETQVQLLQSSIVLTRAYQRVRDRYHIEFPTNADGDIDFPKIKGSQIPKSSVIELRCKGSSERAVVAFLNATMEAFLDYKKEVRQSTSGDTYSSVSEQTRKQENDLNLETAKLNEYMERNNVGVLEEQAKVAGTYLTQLLYQRSELRQEYEVLESLTNFTKTAPDLRIVNPAAAQPPELIAAITDLEKNRIVRESLGKYLRPAHPKIVKLDERIKQGEKLVAALREQSAEQIANLKKTVASKKDRIDAQIKEWEAKISDASGSIANYERQKSKVMRLVELHDHMLGLLMQVDITKTLDHENISVLDAPSQAKEAKKSAIVASLLLMVGLGVGMGLVFLIDQTDDRIQSTEEAAHRFDEWLVGQVPDVPRERKKALPAPLEVGDERHAFAESYRAIRSALLFSVSREERPKVILVTSAVPKEGKSTLAANLARTIAFSGSRVLLIDADLRRGCQHELFGKPATPGLSELLSREGDLSFYLVPTSVPNLTLIPRGEATDSSGELLLGPACDRLLARVRKDFDVVIIDSIPVFAADDTTSLAPKVDGVLFVVRNSFTSAQSARHALEMLYERQARVLGIVYNRAGANSRSHRYYKYSDYSRAGKRG